jgi:hypothetical protein
MEMANTLAYYDMATITAVKCFIVQALGVKIIFYDLERLSLTRFFRQV